MIFTLATLASPTWAAGACSASIGKATLNEYNHQGNFVEVRTLIGGTDFTNWKVRVYTSSSSFSSRSLPSNETCGSYQVRSFASNQTAPDADVVLLDASDNVVDILRGRTGGSVTGFYPKPTCSYIGPSTDVTGVSSAQKGIDRLPDGTGGWRNTPGTGSGSIASRCGGNTPDTTTNVDLVMTKTVGASTIQQGQNTTFTLGISNTGPDVAVSIQVSDTLPSGLTYVSNTAPTAGAFVFTSTTTPMYWNIITLASGASASMTITVTGTTPGTWTNTAAVVSDNNDTNSANNTANSAVVVTIPGPNHVELVHDGAALTCTPKALTVLGCTTAASCNGVSANHYTAGSFPISLPAIAGAQWCSDSLCASPLLSPATVTDGTVIYLKDTTVRTDRMSGTSSSASNTVIQCANTSTSAFNATTACDVAFGASGFLVSLPNHVSCTNATLTVQAVQSSNNATNCVPMFSNQTRAETISYSYSDPSSGTLQPSVAGTAISTGGTSVNLSFNNVGVATPTFVYQDVGRLSITVTDPSLPMTGSTSTLPIIAPASLAFTGIPAAPLIAGNAFSAGVTAINACATPAATPNFGKETIPETVELKAVTTAAASAANSQLVGPVGGETGTLTAGAFTLAKCSPASAGSVCDTALIWTEVGDLILSAALQSGSYLGSGLSAWGSAAANGFRPAYFDTAVTPGIPTFTYSRQPFMVTVTARNALGGTTANYAGSYAQLVTLSDANTGTNNSATLGSFANASIPAASFTVAAAGVASTTTIAYGFNNPATVPITLAMRAVDAGGVSSSGHAEGTNLIRGGRLQLSNAVGSEQLSLTVPALVQYYDGSNWLTSTLDSSSPSPWAVAPAGSTALVGVGNTTATLGAALASGLATLSASAPGANTYGYLDLTVNPPDYLKFPWSGCAVPAACVPAEYLSPTSRVTFGIFKGNNRIIYRRERY